MESSIKLRVLYCVGCNKNNCFQGRRDEGQTYDQRCGRKGVGDDGCLLLSLERHRPWLVGWWGYAGQSIDGLRAKLRSPYRIMEKQADPDVTD